MTPWNRIGSVTAARPVSSGLEAQIEEPPGNLRLRDRATLRPLEVCCSKGNADRGASAMEIVSWPDYPDLANRVHSAAADSYLAGTRDLARIWVEKQRLGPISACLTPHFARFQSNLKRNFVLVNDLINSQITDF